MGIFSGMDQFGLGKLDDIDIISKPSAPKRVIPNDTPVEIPKKEEDFIYDKHYKCTVCDRPFSAKCVKLGKIKMIKQDTDLRPVYEFMNPAKYDVVSCPFCGYSSLSRFYGKLSTRNMRDIREKIGYKFEGLDDNAGDIYSYDDAIVRHKLAVLCSVIKNAKNSERAYTCLKLAWIIRAYRETLPADSPKQKSLREDEKECLANAYEGFCLAISNEDYPIVSMDENTIQYILADIARQLGRYEESARLLAKVLISKTIKKRLKEQALDLKELLKADIARSKMS